MLLVDDTSCSSAELRRRESRGVEGSGPRRGYRILIAVVPVALTVGFWSGRGALVLAAPPRHQPLALDPRRDRVRDGRPGSRDRLWPAPPPTTLLRLTLHFPDRAPSRLAVAMNHHYIPGPAAREPRAPLRAASAGRACGADPRPRRHQRPRPAPRAAQRTGPGLRRVDRQGATLGRRQPSSAGRRSCTTSASCALPRRRPQQTLQQTVDRRVGPPGGASRGRLELAQPLREWLGPWLDVIGQHHERWHGEVPRRPGRGGDQTEAPASSRSPTSVRPDHSCALVQAGPARIRCPCRAGPVCG